jgi:RimJ/RimL family protein N-acetyltransferase
MTANIPHPYPAEMADPFIFETRKGNATGQHMVLAVTPKGRPAELIGMVGAHRDPEGKPFIGYWFGKDHWGQGYATEAAQALIDAVFMFTDRDRIEASARVVNPASRRVLHKCGFRHAGSVMRELTARGGLFPCDSFQLERSTWEAIRAWGRAPLPAASSERPRLVPMSLALPWSGGLVPA